MAQITSLVMKKVQFNHFPIIRSFLLPWQPNQDADRQKFGYFELSYAMQHLYQIVVLLLLWFWRSSHLFIIFFLNLMLPWQPNKMATGHQTHKLVAHITSLVMEKLQLNHFPIIILWELSVAMATKPRGRSPQF